MKVQFFAQEVIRFLTGIKVGLIFSPEYNQRGKKNEFKIGSTPRW
jgi:hypothetical protein